MKITLPIYISILILCLNNTYGQNDTEILKKQKDSTEIMYYIIEGDTIAREMIDLDEVILLDKLKFKSEEDRRRYLILRRKTRKVYPYAKLASERLTTMTERLETIKRNSDRRRYTKRVQKYIEGEFSEKLKKMTHTEGQILVKLIYRQTGRTAFDLVKELRTGWRAFWYNTTASLFEISLKEEYKPFEVKEDYLIEDILERSFQESKLEHQEPSFPIDFLDLKAHWNKKTVNN
ncbi:DUF4294 domain-containing protein [Aequorivita lipolytica]|uniref:DUF4294 domain-containing protein n=1 Tax=Aequorivita lipolytica TaxID=153267 RepID=A0A5C6YL29_9FLAO|nr:DUF4294 domain-containing protein [Aequorivita lipolytica]TXD67786.1 DUF4294 domain-containing protein [Aequorivita lipolytica]SRX54162.1 hypothetical protein AEQU2_03066 [Aequorivita lipolytica]